MRLTLPVPPSANAYWKLDRRGFIRVSNEARAYKLGVQMRARIDGLRNPLTGPVGVRLEVFRPAKRGDLDNFLKVLLDALKGVAFADDGQVCRIEAERFEDKENPRVEIEVEELAP